MEAAEAPQPQEDVPVVDAAPVSPPGPARGTPLSSPASSRSNGSSRGGHGGRGRGRARGPRVQPTISAPQQRDGPLAADVTIEEHLEGMQHLGQLAGNGGNSNGGDSTRKQYDTAYTKYFKAFCEHAD